jgi:hypothetical protein
MRSFLRRLKAAWLFSQVHPHVDELPGNFWVDEDAKALSKFLTSRTGNKWRLFMLRHVQESAFRATMERNYAAYECGYASGCRGIMAINDSLLAIPAPAGELPTEESDDAVPAELFDKYAP